MTELEQAFATLRDYVERSTHWREGGATRHDALQAFPVLADWLLNIDAEQLKRIQGVSPKQAENGPELTK